MREYYAMRSKYKENGSYINALTYSPKTTLAKSHEGTYRYYHLGNLIWEVEADDTLFTDLSDGTFYDLDFDEQITTYPIFKKYSDSTEEMYIK